MLENEKPCAALLMIGVNGLPVIELNQDAMSRIKAAGCL
jgi:hypothetical protein